MLRRQVAAQPDARPYPNSAMTYAGLLVRAQAVATRLGAATPPGSRVMLAHPPGDDQAAAFYGAALAGMVAVPVPGLGGTEPLPLVERAVAVCAPQVLLTTPSWSYQIGDLGRVRVMVTDGTHVDGEPVGRLTEEWRPVGVLPTSGAYLRYVEQEAREAEFTHTDVLTTLLLLSRTARLGLDERHLGWLASVHGLELGWRVLLPVFRGLHHPVG
ncbi:hypothetical protein AQ490_17565 [Wenjunlia vitaminophila]|uniref:AMP-dependent synthetase/ligase domain-containing protein n=1 Tax=Wenjunlia vitaminophila TaxID=76728 RepID=A0A0T6LVL5_WENVI|nr:AMP-binding protein [Wenjunlia vitaminophila]KRV50033.1 hypothetical protein AQ490_17565 [Wenjunlia vitaminophila]